MKKYKLHKKF